MTLNETYLLIHILSAIVWLGSGISLTVLGGRARKTKDAKMMKSLEKHGAFFGTAIFVPSSLAALASGILMVLSTPAINFTDLWILIGFGGFILSGVFEMGVAAPAGKKLAAVLKERGTVDDDVKAAARKTALGNWLDILTLVIVVWAMVTKPLL